MRRERILFAALSAYGAYGGMQQFNRRVIDCLMRRAEIADRSCEVLLLQDDVVPAEIADRIAVRGCGGRHRRLYASVARRLLRGGIDRLLLGHVSLWRLAALGMLSPGTRTLLFAHGVEVWGEPEFRAVQPGERWLMRHTVDRVASVSRYTARRMQAVYGLPADRFCILPNAVDLAAGADAAELRPGDGGRPHLLSVARLAAHDRDKGIAEVLQALPEVRRRHPGICYEIVGDGVLIPSLRALAASLGVAEAVRFSGALDDAGLGAAYRRADVFVLPSRKEGFGIVFLEAWRHRLPVICGDADAAHEIIDHGINGLAVDTTSPPAIAEAILRLAGDPLLARRMGDAGRLKLEERYTADHFIANLGAILDSGPWRPDGDVSK